jgi:hypothetical protein
MPRAGRWWWRQASAASSPLPAGPDAAAAGDSSRGRMGMVSEGSAAAACPSVPMACSPASVIRSAIQAQASSWRQPRPMYSCGTLISVSRFFFSRLRNTALRAAAGRLLGALASPAACCEAAVRIMDWVSESLVIVVGSCAPLRMSPITPVAARAKLISHCSDRYFGSLDRPHDACSRLGGGLAARGRPHPGHLPYRPAEGRPRRADRPGSRGRVAQREGSIEPGRHQRPGPGDRRHGGPAARAAAIPVTLWFTVAGSPLA